MLFSLFFFRCRNSIFFVIPSAFPGNFLEIPGNTWKFPGKFLEL
jgi:hypothetical protein